MQATLYNPFYGDVTQLNTERTILDMVGKESLKSLTSELMDLLQSSVAIYEKNGDYAYGEFDSAWCQLMDASSRKLCNTDNNKEALRCGKWLCHDDCWNNSALAAIKSRKSTDIDCIGGIKLFAEPIFSDNEVIGVINVGYGNPPTDENRLRELSEKYKVETDTLKEKALAYEKRPDFIVDVVKKRLKSIAQLIGEIVSRKKAEQALRESRETLSTVLDQSPNMFYKHDINHKLTFISRQIEDILGYSVEEGMRLWTDLTTDHPINEAGYKKTLKAIETGKPQGVYDLELRHKEGHGVWVEVWERPITDHGKTVEIVGFIIDVTEKRIIEKSLKESEEKFKANFEMSPGYMCVIDTNTAVFKLVNPTFFKKLGYTEKDMQGKSIFNFIHEDDIEPTKQIVANELKTGKKVIQFQNRYRQAKGGYRWLNWNAHPIEETGITYAAAQDITEIKQYENDLKVAKETAEVNEDKFRKMFNSVNSAIFIYDPDTYEIIESNDATSKLYGYSIEELTGMSCLEFSAEVEKSKSTNVDAIENDKAFVNLRQHKKKDGTRIFTQVFAHKIIISDREYAFAVCDDITEKIKSDEMMRQNNRRLEIQLNLTEMSTVEIDEIYSFSLEKAIELCNSKFGFLGFLNQEESVLRIFSWSPTVMKKCEVKEKYLDFEEENGGLWAEVIRQRKPLMMNEFSAVHPSKKGFPAGHVDLKNYLSVPVFDNKKIVAVISVANKDTDYTESDIQELTYFINGMWNIVKRQMYAVELIEAKERAEQANMLKTEFLNNMSHEIRTPMNGIIGFSEMLDKQELSEEKRKYYTRIIRNSSQQLLNVIDDILEISTLETKLGRLNEEEFSLNDLLMELFSIFSIKSNDREVPLYIKKALSNDESYIISDKGKLNKILSNLLQNAAKFTAKGFIEIGYFVKDERLNIYVKDTGIGISPENHEIIFERFSQEEKEISRKQGGLGLGLSISKENAQLLGGEITLESEKGKGATFNVSLPYKPVRKKQDADKKQKQHDVRENVQHTILIAEDEEVNYLFIEALFEDEFNGKYKLIHAINGKQAVDICLKESIDLVLMDIKMPVMNGHEATAQIKSNFPHLPVIAQTAYSTEADREKALSHGCDDFISKPITQEILFELVNSFLK